MKRFTAKRIAITGAASGLGRAVAIAMAQEGAHALMLMDVEDKGLVATAKSARPGDVKILTHVLDVADAAAMAQAARVVADELGGVDILISSAGILGPQGPIVECREEDFDRILAVNVRGTYLAARHFIPLMKQNGKGSIVNFGSTAGLTASALFGPYSVTKSAVIMMTRAMALNHAADHIRVNCVCPGSIETPMLEQTIAFAGDREARRLRQDAYRIRHPMARFGLPDEVAEAVLFLASDAASFITGVALPVDGGRLA